MTNWTTDAIAIFDEFMAIDNVRRADCIDDVDEGIVDHAVIDLQHLLDEMYGPIDDETTKQLDDLLQRITA